MKSSSARPTHTKTEVYDGDFINPFIILAQAIHRHNIIKHCLELCKIKEKGEREGGKKREREGERERERLSIFSNPELLQYQSIKSLGMVPRIICPYLAVHRGTVSEGEGRGGGGEWD